MLKQIVTDRYVIKFDMSNGIEVLTGINGYDDPFKLDCPSLLDIGIMGHCKNNCDFCYQGNLNTDNMTYNNYKSIIDKVKDHVTQVALGGKGDPNHHENFHDILKYTVDNNIVPNYTTSGIGLSNEQISTTKKYCGAVAVSDYGNECTFDAINRFTSAGCKTNIHFLFTKYSADKALHLLSGDNPYQGLIDLHKVNAIVFLLFKKQGNAKKLEWSPSNDQISEFMKMIRNKKCNVKIGMDSCMTCKIEKLDGFNKNEKVFIDTCEAGRKSAYISPNMEFLPCSFTDYTNSNNNLLNYDLFDIWNNSEIFNSFRNKLETNPTDCPLEL